MMFVAVEWLSCKFKVQRILDLILTAAPLYVSFPRACKPLELFRMNICIWLAELFCTTGRTWSLGIEDINSNEYEKMVIE
jgi:hypothetical protein